MKHYLILVIVCMIFGCKGSTSNSTGNVESLLNELAIDSSKKEFIGREFAKLELEKFIKDSTSNLFNGKVLLETKDELITFAEPFLFKIYGKQNILKQRPYEIYLFNEYWIMMGTLPKGYVGGTFTIAVNRKTCEIIGITHGK
jgi:hypothetical protein